MCQKVPLYSVRHDTTLVDADAMDASEVDVELGVELKPGVESLANDASIEVLCLACDSAAGDFTVRSMRRRAPKPRDVVIEVKYCGVCHSDLHFAAGQMSGVTGAVQYPMCPGHEIAGVVSEVGSEVTRFEVGDKIGVGCMVDSCGRCAACEAGEEQRCAAGNVPTYGGTDKYGRAAQVPAGRQTLGGYTDRFVVHENFGVKIPSSYPLELAGPVMCAGVTTYDPIDAFGAGAGTRVGVVGLGGLGQFGVKIAKARGCVVTVISQNKSKEAFARRCGADAFVVSSDEDDFARHAKSLDLILNTVPVYHDYAKYRALLVDRGGRQVMLGLHTGFIGALLAGNVVGVKRSTLSGSAIGSVRATQEAMDLCATHDIRPDVEVVPCTAIHEVYQRLDDANDSGKRYVLDVAGTMTKTTSKEEMGPPPTFAAVRKRPTVVQAVWEMVKILVLLRWR